jgi:hypothetical protein
MLYNLRKAGQPERLSGFLTFTATFQKTVTLIMLARAMTAKPAVIDPPERICGLSYTSSTKKLRSLRGYVSISNAVRAVLAEIYYPKGY